MRWRPFTWLLLSVFFFVAAAYFWRLGDEWAAKKASPATSPSTNQPLAKPAAKPTSQAAPVHLLAQPGNLNNPSSSPSPNTNRFDVLANRLSNTTQPLG